MATSARCLNRQEKHTASPTVIWTMEGASQTRNADLSHWYVWELPAHLSLSVWRGPLNAHQLAQRNFALEKEIKEQCVPSELYNYSYTLILFVVSEEVILNSLSPPFLSLSSALILKSYQAARDLVTWPTVTPATMMRSPAPLQNTAQSVRTFKTIWKTQDASVTGPTASGGIKSSLATGYNY